MSRDAFRARWPALLALLVACPFAPAQPGPLEFRLTFSRAVSAEPFRGRVYVLLFRKPVQQLQPGPDWFQPDPFFARDVTDWEPGQPLTVGAGALSFPMSLDRLPRGVYSIQAVMDFDRGGASFSTAEGNGFSRTLRGTLDPAASGTVSLHLDQVYHAPRFPETGRVRLVDIGSRLLTAFHGRAMRLRAGVVLPASFEVQPGRRYPVVYEIPGFGGDHFGAFEALRRNATVVGGVEMIHVMLDPTCRLGHHVFADSDNNGPCGRALVEELIPFIERKFRGLGSARGRFLTGHSSGGWSSLWLQVSYPDFFGGVWSTAPDPVDFRCFQGIDLSRPEPSWFWNVRGQARPLARQGGQPVLYFKHFSDMEAVMGRGGQLASFEAVFSPRGPDGRPVPLWDRATGAIDPAVARAWQRYDLRLCLEKRWQALGPRLAGKLHVYVGDQDTFYLDGAVALLRDSLRRLGSDAVIEVVPGRDHNTLLDPGLRQRIAREMAERIRGEVRAPPAAPLAGPGMLPPTPGGAK